MTQDKMFLSVDLVYNYLVDLKKKEINPIDRAKIIREYMDCQKIGLREMSRELGMPASTLQEWVNYSKITKEEYENYKNQGLGETAIRELVTDNKPKIDDIKFNKELNVIYAQLSLLPLKVPYNERTLSIIEKIDKKIKLMKMYILLNEKRSS